MICNFYRQEPAGSCRYFFNGWYYLIISYNPIPLPRKDLPSPSVSWLLFLPHGSVPENGCYTFPDASKSEVLCPWCTLRLFQSDAFSVAAQYPWLFLCRRFHLHSAEYTNTIFVRPYSLHNKGLAERDTLPAQIFICASRGSQHPGNDLLEKAERSPS